MWSEQEENWIGGDVLSWGEGWGNCVFKNNFHHFFSTLESEWTCFSIYSAYSMKNTDKPALILN